MADDTPEFTPRSDQAGSGPAADPWHDGTPRLWRLLALCPICVLALVLAAQTLPGILWPRALWFSDEVRYANVFEHLSQAGKWLVMYLNGEPYPDKPPVYFWLLAALRPLFKGPEPALFFTGAAVSALAMLGATLGLNRLVAKGGRGQSLAAGLILTTCFYWIGVAHYSRMDLLFAALICCSHICLFRAWQKSGAPGLCLAGFGLAALAVLTKGPLGIVFPLAAAVGWLAWRGQLRRLWRRDTAMGLALAVLVMGAWLGGAWLMGEHDFVRNIFTKQIFERAVQASHHRQPWWHYFATLPLAWLPWTFIIFLLPLRRLAGPSFWSGLWASRRQGNPGLSYVWAMALTGFAVLSLVSIKIIIYLMPLFPALAVLTARALGRLDRQGVKRLCWIAGGVFAAAAVNLPLADFMHPWPIELHGLWISAATATLAAVVMFRFAARMRPAGALLVLAACVTLWLAPLQIQTTHALDPVMSPRAQGESMGEYIDQGYTAVAYRIYSGTYTYYAGHNILEVQDYYENGREISGLEKILTILKTTPKVVLGMRRKYWDQWEDRPETLRIVHEQWIVDRPYVLAVQDRLPVDVP